MISVSEAQKLVLERASPRPATTTQLGPAALGLVLAEDIHSDIDSPPYDKSMMDGYALRFADLRDGVGRLRVVEEITAGKSPTRTLGPGESARIMTGAPIPQGADTVVMHERTRTEGDQVDVEDRTLQAGKNVMLRGQEAKAGDQVMSAGAILRAAELGVLAAVGRAEVQARPAPKVAILATGDELVDAPGRPGPGQIRNSNGPMLVALAQQAGAQPRYLGIARDQLQSLRTLVSAGLDADMLVLSGGVSAGKLDLVPQVLAELGVESIFHQVHLKPGKPCFFGAREQTLVFGLPGNPVSTLVCFELFAAPALRRLAGHPTAAASMIQAELAVDWSYKTDRPTYHPARLEMDGATFRVRPMKWFGSPDLRAVLGADAFVLFEPGDKHHRTGETFNVLVMSGRGWC